jgi:hypothetical protein
MPEVIALYLIAAALAVIAVRMGKLRGERGPQGIPGPSGPAGESPAHMILPPQVNGTPGISQVLKMHNGDWLHHGWVRDNSAAWQKAYDTPGLALRPSSGEIEPGVQK